MKVLFIGLQDIFGEISNGGSQCSRKNFDLISRIAGENNVYAAIVWNGKNCERKHYFKRVKNGFESLWASMCMCKFYLPSEERRIVSYIEKVEPDIIYFDSSLLGKIIKKVNGKTIVFFHNVEADYAWNKVKREGCRYFPAFVASKYNEQCAMKADRIVCLNKRDSSRLNALYGRSADFIMPISFTDTFDENKTNCNYKREILFLGSMFPPNVASIEWFIKEVMPQLRNITLNIVGKDFERNREKYEKYKNVKVIGTVSETAPYYYQHAAVVLPIQYGAGMKVKTAEAMMYGRKIFASDEALEGYDIESVEGIVRCNSAEEYSCAINHYFEIEKHEKYDSSVRQVFLEKYETLGLEKKFEHFMENL